MVRAAKRPRHPAVLVHAAANLFNTYFDYAKGADTRDAATSDRTLVDGMRALGFETLLDDSVQAPIITSFLYPEDPGFEFSRFYDTLNRRGYVIYPGKVTDADCFRIGSIGRLFPQDVDDLLAAVAVTLREMGLASTTR